jgi:hypothetical protein
MLKSVILAAAVASAAVVSARANDSSAELATGGLVFVQNDDVEMRAEDLFISTKEVRVTYRFFNKSAKDVTVLVAFPLPEVRISEQDQNISLPTEDPVNFLAFTTTVNGQPVATQVEQRVSALGIDRTQYLRDLGIPLAPHLNSTDEALDRLPPGKWDEMLRLGLADIEEYDAGKGMQKHLAARWGLTTTFYWEQTFPAQKETVVEQHYRPSVGASVQTELGAPHAVKEPWYDEYRRKYCIDRDFYATVDRLRKAAKSEFGPPYSEQRIDYILKTAANWSGPVKDFRLVVDKGDADSLVSFCADGVKKVGPTQFEVRKTDFVPEGNLSVLILKKMTAQ